ncbi:MAG: ABC transporter substrate-binding protein [Oscillospiraceae bacterium]|jgi:peptide/nickel transport system substrate-binding protein|nr:ABC transporter substrate-binding protein [Oscillospiraceae bacterium]
MKKNLIRTIASTVLAALLLSFTACASGGDSSSSSQTAGDEFVFGMQTQPDHLDPFLAATADTRNILFNLFEGLVKPDKDGNLNPAVAESYTMSDDATSYTFKIRKGIKFHNGKEVTAEDVKYSLDTAAGLSGGELLVKDLANIKSVQIDDASTVTLNLKQADYEFLPYLTSAIIPKDYTEQDQKPIGTGPFAFESYTPQQSLVLKKNADYWQKDLPKLDRVTFKLETDSNALLMDLQGGSIDGASIANNVASQVGSGFQIIQSNSNAVQLLALNNAKKPFDNAKVRQAISYAINPDEIISTVNDGKAVRCGTPVIPGLKKYFNSSLTNAYDQNTEKAKQLLSEAGYADGFTMKITVPSNYTVHVDTAQVIISQLKKAGITAEMKQVDFATWLSEAYTQRNYEATVISVDGTTLSPRSYLSRYVSDASNNFVNYKNTEFDSVYKQAENESAEDKRVELYNQAQEILSKDAASVYIQDIANVNVLKDGFAGLTPYPLHVFDASVIYRTK